MDYYKQDEYEEEYDEYFMQQIELDRQAAIRRKKRQAIERERLRKRTMIMRGIGLIVVAVVVFLVIVFVMKNHAQRKSGADFEQQVLLQKGEELIAGWNTVISTTGGSHNSVLIEESQKRQKLMTQSIPARENITIEELPDSFQSGYTAKKASKVYYPDEEQVFSEYAILINESDNTIVADKNGTSRIYPASMTKVLTILVAAENIEDWDATVTITQEMTDYAYVNDCSCVGYMVGEQAPVKDLFYGTILPSGADAAYALATYVAGSHEEFVELMNQKARELGLTNSHFTNCVGLYADDHYSTPYDMAMILKAAVENDWCRQVMNARIFTTASTTEHPEGLEISNWFLRRIEDKMEGEEVICAKTGFVNQSRSCAASYGVSEKGTPYICVTAGAESSWRCIKDHVAMYDLYAKE